MKKSNKGIRKNTIIKSAICFFIFYIIMMSALTIMASDNIHGILQKESNYDFSYMQSNLTRNIEYNETDHYTEVDRLVNLNMSMIGCLQQLSDKSIYCSAKLTDENGNVLCSTGNVLNVYLEDTDKFVFLDKIMSKKQISQLQSFAHNGRGFKSKITGIVNGCEIIPQKIICIRNDNKQIEFNFSNRQINNSELTNSTEIYGVYEYKFNKTNEEVKTYVNNQIKNNLNPVITSYKNSSELKTSPQDNQSSLFKTRYTDWHLIENSKTKALYFLAYSYAFCPLSLAMEQLIPLYIFCLFVTLLLIWILSSKLSNWIVKPILLLNKSAINMTNGERNVSYNLEKHRYDEIGQLADNLSFMSKNLNEAMDKLEEDVDYRKKLEKSRRNLTNAIAHELKTPLGIIRSYSESLKEKIDEDKKDYYLDVIIDETEQMDKMVIEMLSLSKLEANAYKLKPEPFSLKTITEEEIERYKKSSEEKQINFKLICNSEFEIIADKAGIKYVISNFISNAIKHTPLGLKIIVKIEIKDKKVFFSIENQGDKIPKDKLPKIWESFYKVDDSRERKLGGTGLGLAIAKNYLELHRAEYGCRNTKIGVIFWFSLAKN
ncbi:MAG: HAMP domain-containing sensor histidine kinase [Eubacteriales bacterium]